MRHRKLLPRHELKSSLIANFCHSCFNASRHPQISGEATAINHLLSFSATTTSMYNQPARSAAPALGPQVAKRLASSTAGAKQTPRQGRKGHLYGPQPSHPAVTPEEAVRITKRRIAKAERDERMDITLALTPVKTCVALLLTFRIFGLM